MAARRSKRELSPHERQHWQARAEKSLAAYRARGIPLVVAIKAGIRELKLRGLAKSPEGEVTVSFLKAKLAAAYRDNPNRVSTPSSGLPPL